MVSSPKGSTPVGGKVKKFTWTYEGRRREGWGFTVQVDGRQVRKQGWNSKAEAQDPLDAFREEQENPAPEPPPVVTFKQAVERYEPGEGAEAVPGPRQAVPAAASGGVRRRHAADGADGR